MPVLESNIIQWFYTNYFTFLMAILCIYVLLETLIPLFPVRVPLLNRWIVNLSLYMIFSIIAYGIAYFLGQHWEEQLINEINIGLFHWLPNTSLWLQFIILLLVSDFIAFWLHAISHNWRPLWRLHLVHHTDLDVDVTTTFRDHPLSYLLAIIIEVIIIVLLGIPFILLILLKIIQGIHSLYTHTNVKIPRSIEEKLRLIIVTSDMHRIHHDSNIDNTNSNYGMIFSFWDRMFKTYKFLEWDKQKQMELGLEYYRNKREQSLLATLQHPFTYSRF